MKNKSQKKSIIIIDAETANPNILEFVFNKMANHSQISSSRIYGDWRKSELKFWREFTAEYDIKYYQQNKLDDTPYGNDGELLMETLCLAASKEYDILGFVSSSLQYRKLIRKIRQYSIMVFGFGDEMTPFALKKCCDYFYNKSFKSINKKGNSTENSESFCNPLIINIISEVFDKYPSQKGWIDLSKIGRYLRIRVPEISPRQYGFKSLKEMLQATELFEVGEMKLGENGPKSCFVKIKDKENFKK